MNNYTKELFYFYPEKYNFYNINSVYLIGEFNEWGTNEDKLSKYRLIQDKTGRWLGLFDVPKGTGAYKFLINNTQFYPVMENNFYSTTSGPDWAQKAIWYQIMVDRFYNADSSINPSNLISWDSNPDYFNNFGGDLKGIIEKIPYLKTLFGSLKDKALYLNPLHKSLSSNHKYWPEDFATIDPQFGTEEDLQELINVIHNEKGRIILDLVYNHTGINHYAFLDIIKNGNNSQYINWYRQLPNLPTEKIEIPLLQEYIDNKPINVSIENDPRTDKFNPNKESFLSIWNGKYKFPINEPQKFKEASVNDIIDNQPFYKLIGIHRKPNYACWWDLFEIPALNTCDTDVKRNLFDSARKWIKMGVDGFRLDVPQCLKNSYSFWAEFRQEISEEAILNNRNPQDIYITGEIWFSEDGTPAFLYADKDSTPIRFNSIMNYPIRENVLNFLSDDVLRHAFDIIAHPGDVAVSQIDQNIHNNLGYISWQTDKLQYNVFSSHDTRRLISALKNNINRLKAALIMQFTLPGSPAIYYGDEIGTSGTEDPDCRKTMNWSLIENIDDYSQEKDIFNFYKELIRYKTETSCLTDGILYTLKCDDTNKIYAFSRFDENNCSISIIIKDQLQNDICIELNNTPLNGIKQFQNPFSKDVFIVENQKILISPECFNNTSGIILQANFT